MLSERRITHVSLLREVKALKVEDGHFKNIEKACVRYLQARGYQVLIGLDSKDEYSTETSNVFACKYGHNHRTALKRDRCELLRSDEYKNASARKKEEHSSERKSLICYEMYNSGMRKCDIAKEIGRSSTRASYLVRKGFRIKLKILGHQYPDGIPREILSELKPA